MVTADCTYMTRISPRLSIEERRSLASGGGCIVWFTGLPGSGKTTLAAAVERALLLRGLRAYVLDGDDVRHGLSADLGFSNADRAENVRRVAHVARMLAEAGLVVLTALISPLREHRAQARRIAEQSGIRFLEVYLTTPLAVCEVRDPKGLYARARAGAIQGFTGVSAPFEPAEAAEVVIDTSLVGIEPAVDLLVARIVGVYTRAAA